MARLHETVDTPLSIDRAFAFVADFSNSAKWDPGTVSAKAVGDATPRVGTEYELQVRMGGRTAPMTYVIETLDPGHRIVLRGRGPNVSATDDIRFETTARGTRIDYRADIELTGLLRLAAPFAGSAFKSIGKNARDGMQRTLDAMALAAGVDSATDASA